MDRTSLIKKIIARESERIYCSVVQKLERESVRRGTLPTVPYIDERDRPSWRKIRGVHGFAVLKRVVEPTFAMRGWKVKLTANHAGYLHNGKRIDLRVTFTGLGISFPITTDLPVLENPLWCPRRYGGIWTVFELQQGCAWLSIQKLITEIDRRLYFKLPTEIMDLTIGSPSDGPLILPTPHVCHITRTPYDGELTHILRAQKRDVRHDLG